ncbi:uncharacterized protein LOC112592650 [Melanaphis sacchari]|uniref:uncharacterized protein LOC112592650 n=1 Tax=Melanaphis sacchari TaxID=742174 RepID=UPI000DC150BB|nr:uncharacterized protein LOC112592650 [Melanaphis sacchari]
MTLGIIDKNGRKIVNFLQFVNANNIYSMDKFFIQFVDELNSWWLHNIIDMEYEPKRIHSSTTILQNIIIDDMSVMEFYVPTNMQLNNILILACLMTIETKLILSNIYDHVRIIMCVIKYNFIDKHLLKKVLNDLVLDEYLYTEKYNTATIYKLNTIKIINTINTHKHGNKLINKILYIDRNSYLRTAIFYNVSLFKKKRQLDVNTKTKIFQSIQQKYFFIKNFIDHILKTHFPNVSYDKIKENYITEVQNYQNNLKSLLQLLPKKSIDSSLTVTEILQMIQNQQAITYRPPTTPL